MHWFIPSLYNYKSMNGWVYQWKMDYWPTPLEALRRCKLPYKWWRESGSPSRKHDIVCVCSPAWHVWVTHWRVCLPFWKLARLFGHLTHHRIILNKQILEKTNFGYETNLKNRSYTQHFHTDCGWPDQGPRTWDNVRSSPKERLPSWL